MKIILILLNLFIIPFSSHAMEERRARVLNIIDEELKEIARLNRMQRKEDPDFLLRMAELFLEKARLYKEYENEQYIALAAKNKTRKKKSAYFRTSKKYFQNAQKICRRIIKRFKGYRRRGEVFYIMAFNAKEFGEYNEASRFFKKAIKESASNSDVRAKSGIALAGIHYNKNNFRSAIPLYERYLKKRGNKWWTKSAYNLAWCYFRVKSFSKAISTMKEIHRLSKDEKYIDMRYQVERNFIVFFAEANRMDEGIEFYEEIDGDVAKNLLRMGKRLVKQGRFSNAAKVFKVARRKRDNDEQDVDIYLAELEIYESLNQNNKYLNASKKLLEYYEDSKIGPEQKKQFLYKIKTKAGNVQKYIAKNRKSIAKTKRMDKANLAKTLFIILSKLEPEKSAIHVFFAGESLYAVGEHEKAFKLYRESMKLADKHDDIKTKKKALDGVMATLGSNKLAKRVKDKHIIEAYEEYMNLHPRSKKTSKIYQRLFTLYFKRKEIEKAEEILLKFKRKFPKERKVQEAMLAKVIDFHKKKDNKSSLRAWIRRVVSGEFRVSKKVAHRLKLLLLNIQFEKVEEANKKGNKSDALAGYIDIYDSSSSTMTARRNSAYNAAVLLHETGDAKGMHKWSLKTLEIMNEKQARKANSTFLTIAIDLFNRREFSYSADLYTKVFKKFCRQKLKNKKIFFKNAAVVYLAIGKYDEVQELLSSGRVCGIPSTLLTSVRKDVLDSIVVKKDFDELESWVSRFLPYRNLGPYLIHPLFLLYKMEVDDGDDDEAEQIKRQMIRLYKKAKRSRQKIPLKGLDSIAGFSLIRAEEQLKSLKEIKLEFPENEYNGLLQKKFGILNKLTEESLRALKIGSGKGIVRAYYLLVKGYYHVVKSVLNFTPPGKSSEYVSSFKNSMKSLILPVKRKMMGYHKSARIQINKHNILSIENNWFITSNKLGIKVEHFLRNDGILMDKRGR